MASSACPLAWSAIMNRPKTTMDPSSFVNESTNNSERVEKPTKSL